TLPPRRRKPAGAPVISVPARPRGRASAPGSMRIQVLESGRRRTEGLRSGGARASSRAGLWIGGEGDHVTLTERPADCGGPAGDPPRTRQPRKRTTASWVAWIPSRFEWPWAANPATCRNVLSRRPALLRATIAAIGAP